MGWKASFLRSSAILSQATAPKRVPPHEIRRCYARDHFKNFGVIGALAPMTIVSTSSVNNSCLTREIFVSGSDSERVMSVALA
jgi:hypothetical protein